MTEDPELRAMTDITKALGGLEPEIVARVLRWAGDRYQVPVPVSTITRNPVKNSETEADGSQFDVFASLHDAANPRSSVENALVGAYWCQEVQGAPDFDGLSVNRELKHLGRQSSNITRDLDALMNRSPRLVIQIRKTGSSKQSRKKYKLTTEGKRVVERMLAGTPLEAD